MITIVVTLQTAQKMIQQSTFEPFVSRLHKHVGSIQHAILKFSTKK